MFFNYNGTLRSTMIKDKEASKSIILHPKSVSGSLGSVGAPMPGEVVKLTAKVGDKVQKGDTLVVLSAMKMETNVPAPCNGVVLSVPVTLGQSMSKDDLLVDVREE